jgi:hypothetical protein
MKKWYQILWGSKEEDAVLAEKVVEKDIDPADLTIENAYKTRWIWYHTILAGLMFILVIEQLIIILLIAIKI